MDFYKKPVKVQAVQLTWENWPEMCDFASVGAESDQPRGVWCNPETGQWTARAGLTEYPKLGLVIPTLEGDMLAIENDYVIRGTQGELYPCKPNAFEDAFTTTPPEVLHHDEKTMTKVYDALTRASTGDIDHTAVVSELQNAGILFRERSPE